MSCILLRNNRPIGLFDVCIQIKRPRAILNSKTRPRPTQFRKFSVGLDLCLNKYSNSFLIDKSNGNIAVGHCKRVLPTSLWSSTLKCIPCAAQLNRAFHFTTPNEQEAVVSDATKEEHSFQAETRMLLDIVARSLYSDKEVFIRELVSNASDALEKVRCLLVQGTEIENKENPLKISIETDKHAQILTIRDNGIGMTKDELISNLGTIARSGSKEFLQQYNKGGLNIQNIIGQFGVGFYSVFMVADKVEVFTKAQEEGSRGFSWSSDGLGTYTIEERSDVKAGTHIICYLKTDNREYSDEATVKEVLKKYSSFVGFPVEVNDVQVNTLEPLWLKDPKQVSSEEHSQFYKFIGSAYDIPKFILHFQTDAPVSLRCLLYFPDVRPGILEMRDGDVGVSLYCQRILIKRKAHELLPKWLRFVKGVVDSEDIPLNLSREMLQDSALIRKLRTVIQNRAIRFLQDKSRKEPDSYQEFFKNYGIFIKEGIIAAQEQIEKEELAKLIHYESSHFPAGNTFTLAEYVGRMATDEKNIYFLAAPSRELAESSPYFEAMKKRNVEVLFCYETYDEVVLMQMRQYNMKNIVSVEKEIRQSKEKVDFDTGSGLQKSEVNELMDWMKSTLKGRCFSMRVTPHLDTHPCVITVEDMGAARHYIRTQFMQIPEETRYNILQPQLEINPNHPIIMKLNLLRTSNTRLAELLTKQLFYNAMVTAGLIEDPRTVMTSINELLQLALEKH